MSDSEENQPEDTIPSLMMACIALAAEIAERNCDEEKDDLIREHIKKWAANPVPMVDFEAGLEWFNVEKSLSLREDLQDCIVVLDFFTYCCINCMHILPDLEHLEKVFPPTSGVIVVGVHSAKFDNERTSANISAAIERYGIHHAVVNDAQAKMWMELGISCWPTLLILGPNCEPIFVLVGEGHKQRLEHYVTLARHYFSSKRKLRDVCGLVKPSSHVDAQNLPLLYPGKVAVFPQGIIIADSGHHRILVTDKNGTVKHIVGSGKQGHADGPFSLAEFNTPQGVLFYPPHTIFVADTNNHLIRKVNLETQTVETVVGTGEQACEKDLGGLPGKQQAISSPWDLCFGKSLDLSDEEEDNLLVIAMAGSHQIWAYFLRDGKWFRGSEYKAGTAVCLAGNGEEQNRNTRYPLSASFAQPSGVTWCRGSSMRDVFIADSESSTIRKLQLKDCVVKAVVGGARDPMDLFSFGDRDGCGVEAKLQHPLAVAAIGEAVYVADTYNHKIKVVRAEGKTYSVTAVAGTSKIGNTVGNMLESQFSEPSGLCVSSDQQLLYIADTNNHAIKVLELKKGTVHQMMYQLKLLLVISSLLLKFHLL
ncbi:NHL repeat-containing protein 2 isoform X2 [Oratosquilla oratoria]|uniref:NHL repeat-containing protein 2 isoform X2 n=1 Tax=Oratosquilla oratoria TaxID=337810 RepID=UPI003F7632AC